jgi:hypothetical protein
LISPFKSVAGNLPHPIRSVLRRLYLRWRHPVHSSLKGTGTVQDLYYWTVDENIDTMLLLQNYFSAFYPHVNTNTSGTISLFGNDGRFLGAKAFNLAPYSCTKFKVSSLLAELDTPEKPEFGTLECHLVVPPELTKKVRPSYFFDRFYIGYLTSKGQPTFVHGVDRTHIYREDKPQSYSWYQPGDGHQWTPEIPVSLEDYQRLWVIMINRTSRTANTTLTVADSRDQSRSWSALIEPGGVHRFELTPSNIAGLATQELRLRLDGMATQRGRPVIIKEFTNGAVSAMHC